MVKGNEIMVVKYSQIQMTDTSKSASSNWEKKNPTNKTSKQTFLFLSESLEFQTHIKIWCFSWANIALGSCDNVEMVGKWIFITFTSSPYMCLCCGLFFNKFSY